MNSSDLMPFDCDESYDTSLEILKYVCSFLYLTPGLLLHISLLKCIFVTKRKYFKESSFFNIYAIDSIASVWLLAMDILFTRSFLYIPPLCPLVGPYLFRPSIFLKFTYYTTSHLRFSKSISQIFMVFNRMTCVLMPTVYGQLWAKLTPIAIFLIAILPIAGTWNVLISRVFIVPIYGGMGLNYTKLVPWASLSMFQSVYILTALFFTAVCTSVTLFKLTVLTERIKSAERSLCFSSAFISVAFLLVAATQLCYAVCLSCRQQDLLFIAQFLAFDTLNVGSAVIMVLTNAQLWDSVFAWTRPKDRITQVSTTNNSFITRT